MAGEFLYLPDKAEDLILTRRSLYLWQTIVAMDLKTNKNLDDRGGAKEGRKEKHNQDLLECFFCQNPTEFMS